MKFSEKIKALRQRDQITQKQLADSTGINHSALRKYEIDLNIPQDKHIQAIAKVFNISPSILKDFDLDAFNITNEGDVYAVLINLIKCKFFLYSIDRNNKSFKLFANPKMTNIFDTSKLTISFNSKEHYENFYNWLGCYDNYILSKSTNKEKTNELKNTLENLEFKLCTKCSKSEEGQTIQRNNN